MWCYSCLQSARPVLLRGDCKTIYSPSANLHAENSAALEKEMVNSYKEMVQPIIRAVPAISGDMSVQVLHINGDVVIRPIGKETQPTEAKSLSTQEQRILALVAEGFSNKLIAAELNISENTVKHHLTWIMIKLRASDRTHAVVIAVRLGWLAV